jgi:ribonuclease VapC
MENVKDSYVLDSYAIIAYLKKEKGAEQVRDLLHGAKRGNVVLYLHEINLGEIQYIIQRERGEEESERLVAWLRACPISFVGLDGDILSQAAKIKAVYPLSYADAFAVATTIFKKSQLLTGDPEMQSLEEKIAIRWIKPPKKKTG